jgi:drug/metabolite transporter (DMT)-like permease
VTDTASTHPETPSGAPSARTLAAFLGVIVLGGSNAVAIRVGNLELAPFWGAALRFLTAGLALLVLMRIMRVAWPTGRALAGAVIFGVLNFGLGYAFLYWGLREANAGTAQVVLALSPLMTFLLAVVQRVETFRWLGLVGAIVAAAGVGWIFLESAEEVSLGTLALLLGGTLCFSQAGIVIKSYPRIHAVAENGVAMTVGGVLLLGLSLVSGEPRTIPRETATWLSLVYLVPLGSIALFVLVLFVLHRWTASAAAYALLLMPLMTFLVAALVLHEPLTPSLLGGAALVLAGVYVGAFLSPPRREMARLRGDSS